jgi:hypothetical protein
MNLFPKNNIIALILIACSSITAMERPQLQLENPKEQITELLNCSIMIPDGIERCVMYATKASHDDSFNMTNVQSTIKDPMIGLFVQNNDLESDYWVMPFPAKLFVNCTDKSIVRIHSTDHLGLIKLTAICTKNPKLKGNNFAEQFNNAMNHFYENPKQPLGDKKDWDELINAGIITKQIDLARIEFRTAFVHINELGTVTTFNHGPNGCPNEKVLIKSIIDEKTEPHDNIKKFLSNREIGIRRQRQFNTESQLEVTLSNCLKEIEFNSLK